MTIDTVADAQYNALTKATEANDAEAAGAALLELRRRGARDIERIKAAMPDDVFRETARRVELKLRRALPTDDPHHIKASTNGERKPRTPRTKREPLDVPTGMRELFVAAAKELRDATADDLVALRDEVQALGNASVIAEAKLFEASFADAVAEATKTESEPVGTDTEWATAE
jgi:hypothetical protein